MKEMVIDIWEDHDNDIDNNNDDEQDFLDEDDRQLIDRTLGKVLATSTEQSSANSSPHSDKAEPLTSGARRSLTDLMAGYDPDYLKSVLPL